MRTKDTATRSLFDVLEEAIKAVPLAPIEFRRGLFVRARDGRVGEIIIYVKATERACVRLPNEPRPIFVHRFELEQVPPPACWSKPHTWASTLTIWPGETHVRLTKTCPTCGEIRGRA